MVVYPAENPAVFCLWISLIWVNLAAAYISYCSSGTVWHLWCTAKVKLPFTYKAVRQLCPWICNCRPHTGSKVPLEAGGKDCEPLTFVFVMCLLVFAWCQWSTVYSKSGFCDLPYFWALRCWTFACKGASKNRQPISTNHPQLIPIANYQLSIKSLYVTDSPRIPLVPSMFSVQPQSFYDAFDDRRQIPSGDQRSGLLGRQPSWWDLRKKVHGKRCGADLGMSNSPENS